MKDWERYEERACAEGNFCSKHGNRCCYWCDREPYCSQACSKLDYTKNIPDTCEEYKREYRNR